MNDPIINPIIFYAMDVLRTIKVVSSGIAMLTFCSFVVVFIFWVSCMGNQSDDATKIRYGFKINSIILVVSGLLAIGIPNQSTMQQMLIASYVTPNNISVVGKTVKDSIQDIANIIVDTQKKVNTNGKI